MHTTHKDLVKTARITGIMYLMMAIGGILGFMTFHKQIYVANDPTETLTNLTEKETLARVRLIFEFVIIVSQALTAVWFYKLFKQFSDWGAWALGIWGTVNAVAIMVSAISMGAALGVAHDSLLPYEDKVMLVELLGLLIRHAWLVGSLFFGLWLIPMGYIVLSESLMPAWLGRILIIGGVGYVLSAFLKYMGLSDSLLDILVIPASIGEFWMIGYLLIFGIREKNIN
ncbi:MAG: DUF4386 domain-containing protein [Cyclobacteriaceae bacterium]